MQLFRALVSSLGAIVLLVSALIDAILAVGVLRSNPRSATNRIFFALSISIMLWLLTYVAYFPSFSAYTLLLVRLGIFFAAPMSMLFFLFAHTVPHENIQLDRRLFWIILVETAAVMALNLSPYAFSSAVIIDGNLHAQAGPGLIAFAVISTFFSILAIAILIQKAIRYRGEERKQVEAVLVGIILMLALIIGTVLIPLILFSSGLFVAFLPFYTLAFLGVTAYAITRYHLFDLKVIATAAFVGVLLVLLFSRIFFAATFADVIVDLAIFLATVIFSWLLIKSVRKEIEQREELELVNAKLDAANRQLEDLSRFKSQLLSLASHQIRSPLAAIKGFASLILDGSYGPVDERA
ncbi:MAG: hypothetical protein KGJ13_06780, partial [Patescibacteria group bacterium]|nr:hypothetical protein [Patescibacteria group bacterium]